MKPTDTCDPKWITQPQQEYTQTQQYMSYVRDAEARFNN